MAGTGRLLEAVGTEAGPDARGAGNSKVVFRPSHRGACYPLPPSLDELIGPQNLVRFVDVVVDRLDLSGLIEQHKGGGASACHPASC